MRYGLLAGWVVGWMLSVTSGVSGYDADHYLSVGRAQLFDRSLSGIRQAYQTFDDGLNDGACADCASSRELRFFHAFSRIGMLVVRDNGSDYNSLLHLAGTFGATVTGDQFFPNLMQLGVALNNQDIYEIPPGAPGPEAFIAGLRSVTVPEIEAILAELELINDSSGDRFRLWLHPAETGLLTDLEVDYGDVLVLKGLLLTAKAAMETDSAYDIFMAPDDVERLIQKVYAQCFNLNNDLLAPYPNLGKVLPTPGHPQNGKAILAQARQDLLAGIDYFSATIDYITHEDSPPGTDPQQDELLYIDPNNQAVVTMVQERLALLRSNLVNDTPVMFAVSTTDTYQLRNSQSEPCGELTLVRDAFEQLDSSSLTFIGDGGESITWDVTHATLIGSDIVLETEVNGESGFPYSGNYDLTGAKSLLFNPVSTDQYQLTILESSLFAETGVAQGWQGNGQFWTYVLPFAFPFYGVNYSTIYICDDGFVDLTNSGYPYWYGGYVFPRIIPLGSYLNTLNGGDVYIDGSVAGEVTIRWHAHHEWWGGDYNFSVVLYADGRIRFDYGNCDKYKNSQLVAISKGDYNHFYEVGGWKEAQGTLTGTLSADGSAITHATYEFWGRPQGMVTGLSGQRTGTAKVLWTADLNPIFGSSAHYPNPVSPRDLLPAFDAWNAPLPGTVGQGLGNDATLGGIIPGKTQEQWQREFNLQPGGEYYLNFAGMWGIHLDGNLSDWSPESIVFTDPQGDAPADMPNQDIAALYMAFDADYLYGAITLHEPVDPEGAASYHLYLTYDPDKSVSPRTLYALINLHDGGTEGQLFVELSEDYEWEGSPSWQETPVTIETGYNGGNVIEFRIPFEIPDMPANQWVSFPGRFIHLSSGTYSGDSWEYGPDGDENETHLQIAETGSLSGTISCPDWIEGNPIVVQAYTRQDDPDGSQIASVVLNGPGAYTLHGLAEGWRGYIRAYTSVVAFSAFNPGVLNRQAVTKVYMAGTDVRGVNLKIYQIPEVRLNVSVSGSFPDDGHKHSRLYRFSAQAGMDYYFTLLEGEVDVSVYGRNARTEMDLRHDWDNWELQKWTCLADGIYFLEIGSSWDSDYSVVMNKALSCPLADIAGPNGFGYGDCQVNLLDFAALAEYWLQPNWDIWPSDILDFDGSDYVDMGELVVMAEEWLQDGHARCPSADFTGPGPWDMTLRDCRVDGYELMALSSWWLQACESDGCGGADINHDGMVNLADFALIAGQWLQEGPLP